MRGVAAVGSGGAVGICSHEELLRRHGPHFDGWTQKGICAQAAQLRARIACDGFFPLYFYESKRCGGDQLIHRVIRISRIDVFPDGWPEFLEIAHDSKGRPGTEVYADPAHARLLYEDIALLARPLTLDTLGIHPIQLTQRLGIVREVEGTIPDEWYRPHRGAA
jgi:hypothetical protein